MRSSTRMLYLVSMTVLAIAALMAQGQRPAPTPAQSIRGQFNGLNRGVLEMAKDFPADKYDFRLKPEMRAFGEVIVHVASGNVYAAKIGKGEKAKWEELNPKKHATKD